MPSRLLRCCAALFAAATIAYPRAFRQRFGKAMTDAFLDGVSNRRATRGLLVALLFASRSLANLIGNGLAERRHARRQSVAVTAAREPVRVLWQDVRFAVRMMRRQRGVTFLSITTLAIGLGATTSVFSLVDASLLRPVDLPSPDRLVVAYETASGSPSQLSYANLVDWARMSRSFTALTGMRGQSVNLTGLDTPSRVRGVFVTHAFFGVAGVMPARGRALLPADDQPNAAPVTVISHALWQQQFGGRPDIVGRTAQLNNTSFTIVGVMPPGFTFPFDAADVWIPLQWVPGSLSRAARTLTGFGRLRDDVTVDQARADLSSVAATLTTLHPATNANTGARVEPLHDWLTSGARDQLALVFGLVLVLLAAACANVTSLHVAATAARRAEIGVRTALGAGRARIARQLLTEHLLLAVAGGVAGVAIAWITVPAVVASAPGNLFGLDRAAIDLRVIAFAALVAVGAGLCSGLVPAIHWAAQMPALTLGSARSVGDRRLHRVHHWLVAGQVAIAAILLTAGGLLVQSYRQVTAIDPGYRVDGLHTLEYRLPTNKYNPAEQARFHDEVVERVATAPGVLAAAGVRALPLSGNGNVSAFRTDRTPPDAVPSTAEVNTVTDTYFAVMGIPLLQGRLFESRDTDTAPLVAVVSRSLAEREWPGENPIGRELRPVDMNIRAQVIGVVGDVRQRTLIENLRPTIYVRNRQSPGIFMTLVARVEGDPAVVAQAIRRAVWLVDPQQPVWKERSLESLVRTATQRDRFLSGALTIFSVAALVLVLSGLHGTINQAVSRRSREIGLRMALGADRLSVLTNVLRTGLRTTALGLVVGLVLSVWTARLMTGLLYRTSPLDAMPYVVTAGALMAVSLLASYLPARRAASIDPASALRSS